MIVDCATYRDGRRVEGPADFSDALDAVRAAGDGFLWIGLYEPTPEELDLVSSEFSLHPLAVEDALTAAHQRPKMEVYPDALLTVVKTLGYRESDRTVETGEVLVFVGDCFAITVRHGKASPLGAMRKELEDRQDLLRLGPAAVLYAVCDLVVDSYLDLSATLLSDLDELEADVFAPGRTRGAAERIYAFKRQVVAFRRASAPLLEPATRLVRGGVPFVPDALQPYLRDVLDHLTRTTEQVEALDRLLSDILNANLAQVSVQQNDDMRKISAWAALAAVPTMIAGIYGMNFRYMPELHQPWGYPAALALMALVCLVLHRLFKRAGWL
ncbi:magnesium and cobalt transport protein CorA [Kitasatospora sp. NPDC007106]|uniref:magnesium and cobalt transport protein CorA n=1 Tax=Kitasatospora sp. NPDC007106 TaxID=3156914 RepID=UPI0033C2BC67